MIFLSRLGSDFIGSSEVKSSVANEEILPQACYKLSIIPESDCSASINYSEPIFLKGGIGFSTNQIDAKINSFKILEDGIPYFWIGGI